MRKLLYIALLALMLTAASSVEAVTIKKPNEKLPTISFTNEHGGTITLTLDPCKSKNDTDKAAGLFALVTNNVGRVVDTGCWRMFDHRVIILYDQGGVYMYPLEAFK